MGACDWGWVDTRSICLLHYLVFSKSVVVIRVSRNIWIHGTELIFQFHRLLRNLYAFYDFIELYVYCKRENVGNIYMVKRKLQAGPGWAVLHNKKRVWPGEVQYGPRYLGL